MGKYQNANILQTKIDENNEQQRLKNKHNIADENVVVIEKSNTFKFTVKTVILLIKALSGTALLCLATIGVFTLLYSDLRQYFIGILVDILNSVLGGF